MLGALTVYVGAAEPHVAQHAIIELPEQVAALSPFLPLRDSTQQLCRQSGRRIRSQKFGRRIERWQPICIDPISGHKWHPAPQFVAGMRIKLTRRTASIINLSP